MLLLDTVAQVSIQLADLVASVFEEMILFDHGEISVELLHGGDLGQLRLNRDLRELSSTQFLLQVFVLLLNLVQVVLLISILLISESEVVPEIINDLL